MKPVNVLIPACAAVLLAGGFARAQSPAGTPEMSTSSPRNAPIPSTVVPTPVATYGRVRTDSDRYDPGRPVSIAFVVTNGMKRDAGYTFSTAKQFDIAIADSRGQEVWRLSRSTAYATTLTHLSLPPGAQKTFRAQWDGRDNAGRPVPAGTYTVNAELTFDVRPAITGSVLVNRDVDPNNMGMPTRSPAETGAAREVIVTPPVTGSKKIVITSSRSRF
jgi:hypothetical protein